MQVETFTAILSCTVVIQKYEICTTFIAMTRVGPPQDIYFSNKLQSWHLLHHHHQMPDVTIEVYLGPFVFR